MTGVADVLHAMRSELRTFRDEHGTELFDLPDAPLPDPDVRVPPRFLPEYDNALLSHHDRSRVVDDDVRRRVIGEGAIGLGSVLVDGFGAGTWRVERARGSARLRVRLLAPVSRGDRAAVIAEGRALLAFTDPEAIDRDVRFEPAD
jgi:hypothetical protein